MHKLPHMKYICPAASQVVRLRASVGANNGQILVKAAAPIATVSLLPLLPKRICSIPLADSLLSTLQQSSKASLETQNFSCASMQHGVLTLDQGRSLVPLHAAEAQVARPHDESKRDMPLVAGGWVVCAAALPMKKQCRLVKVLSAGSGSARSWSVGVCGAVCQGCPCVGCLHPLPAVSRLARQGPAARHGLLGACLCAR